MPAPIFIIVGLSLVALESVLLAATGTQMVALHLPVVLAVYLGMERPFATGGVLLACLLVPVEFFVAGVGGVYSLGLVVVFFFASLLRGQVQREWGLARALVGALSSLLHSLVVIALFFAMGLSHLTTAVGWKIAPAMAIVGLMTVVTGRVLAAIDRRFDPRRGTRRLEFS